jgi:hypothetical protein
VAWQAQLAYDKQDFEMMDKRKKQKQLQNAAME